MKLGINKKLQLCDHLIDCMLQEHPNLQETFFVNKGKGWQPVMLRYVICWLFGNEFGSSVFQLIYHNLKRTRGNCYTGMIKAQSLLQNGDLEFTRLVAKYAAIFKSKLAEFTAAENELINQY